MANLQDVLSKKASEIKKAPPVPGGTYIALITGQPVSKKQGQDQTDVLEFPVRLLQPQDDVNMQELQALDEFGGLAAATITAKFFMTEKAAYRAKDFAIACGVEEGDKSLGQMLAEVPGKQVKVLIKQEPSKDGQNLYSNIASYSAV